jgi:hypothetical protein
VSDREFERQIAAIMGRVERLRAAQRGELNARRIRVKSHRVPAYNVGAHFRTIFTKKAA